MPRQRDSSSVHETLRAAGLRATSARVAVLRTLIDAARPLSHAEVCEAVAPLGFDRATSYRNLIDLAATPLVRRSDVGDHIWRFEIVTEDNRVEQGQHPHFVCSDCGTVACLPRTAVVVRPARGTPRALRSRGLEIHVRGRCDACA